MRTDLERSRQNLTKLSTLLDSTDSAEQETADLIRRFHRRSRYVMLAIGISEESLSGRESRSIIEAAKWSPSKFQRRPEWMVIRYGITERSIRFQRFATRRDLLCAVRQLVAASGRQPHLPEVRR